ncbi:pilus assembly protein TadG-related protein [Pseudomonas sp. MUP55]|uniref:pilus assembly protein TadG-related protein n=1 Tax=Pseudomonas sp. MUP55 TaxID=3087234 RepID=UPI002A5A9832|nr:MULTISPECIES: pilus assembly protein TadG-related protein [unclassified Pseudomonas]WPN93407.1 pilus assembly protein TadG-related protein [Pseudomonas sp. MUP56]WPN98933.1 pilus assembly protein TadG-related protein [Pseudomonas sp. MUP55]
MSPHLHGKQRGAVGLMAAGVLALVLAFTLLAVDSGRLYLEKRRLQGVADTAALEAVSRGGTCAAGLSAAAFAAQSVARNQFVLSGGNTLAIRCGAVTTGASGQRLFTANPAVSSAIEVVVGKTVTTSVAGGVWSLFSGNPVSLNTPLTAMAVAAKPTPPMAQLSIKSTLANVDTARAGMLNAIFSGLLGGAVNVSVLGWNGLLNSNINMLSYLDQLALDLHVTAGDYTQLLNTTATASQLLQAAITVLGSNPLTVDAVTALGTIKAGVTNPVPLTLGKILQVQTGTSAAALNANLQVFQLIQGVVQLSGNQSAAAVTLPVNLLGLANISTQIKVIEPPQLSAVGNPLLAAANPLGPNKIYVRTAQLRTQITLSLPLLSSVSGLTTAVNDLVGPLTPVLNGLLSLNLVTTLNSALCLLGAGCQQLDIIPVPGNVPLKIVLDAGGASTYVTGYTCPTGSAGTKSLTAHTVNSIASLNVGNISNAFSSTLPMSVAPLPLVDIGVKTCHKILGIGSCDPRVAFAGGGIAINVQSPVVGSNSEQNLVFSSTTPFATPPNVGLAPAYQAAVPASNLVSGLSTALTGVSITAYQPVGNNPVGSLIANTVALLSGVNALVTPVLNNALSPLLNPILNNLLNSLGVSLANVTVGANLSCGQTGEAYLVI